MFDTLLAGQPKRQAPLRILVADDQPLNIRILHEVFRNEFEVLMTTDSKQVVTICREQNPDLVLLDVVMPGLNGHQVCRQLRALPETRDIPVIFVTAKNTPEDEVLGLESGAVDFITKPINPATVMARVKTHLALKLQNDLLRSIALVDGLTGVANRRRFDEQFLTAWRRCQREQLELSLLLIDLDHFKLYNDHYGHPAGDRCLTRVAGILNETIRRPDDLLARYGGEEFICLLPNTAFEGAQGRAWAMLHAVQDQGLEHAHSPASAVVTISIGAVTMIPQAGDSPETLLNAADKQLYDAKQSGRNQVRGIELPSLP
ncbi:diguanylate cyclase domain-containing protein [Oceanimonas doudoroffii]|uniref:diguanylate cyclase n=1 Tax=Oceanimonas doudoroffii TaxID=84158 RepID=A0A233RGF9_9GAMM|nr:diguanylate cyclase [Oceanimonas doudoroffii]OXY82476.1 diguanylate cyclase response regulator [Oceanimonas doudoroffii]